MSANPFADFSTTRMVIFSIWLSSQWKIFYWEALAIGAQWLEHILGKLYLSGFYNFHVEFY